MKLKLILITTVLLFVSSLKVNAFSVLEINGTENTAFRSDDPLTSALTTGEAVVKTALQYIGTKYRYGKSSPSGFDCSGFTSYVYNKFDFDLVHSSRGQYQNGKSVGVNDLKKGDLVFFGGRRGGKTVGHVGIVTEVKPGGGFKFVHASCNRGVTVSESNEKYYSKRYIGARRLLEE